jgi:hypothetical protein
MGEVKSAGRSLVEGTDAARRRELSDIGASDQPELIAALGLIKEPPPRRTPSSAS